MGILIPKEFRSPSLGRAWLSYCESILNDGRYVPDDREEILEAGPILTVIDRVSYSDRILKRHADPHVIDLYVRKMFSREVIAELNSTYGDRIFSNAGVDQIEWVAKRLAGKWWTKAAAISLLKPNDPGPRIPCLTQLQFTVRDERLVAHAVFRSQNAFRSYGNFLGISEIQKIVAEKLKIDMGPIVSYCVCPHIYRSDIGKISQILAAESMLVPA